MQSIQLLNQLQAAVREITAFTHFLEKETPHQLAEAPAVNQWSVAQILEHLNSYGRYYLPAIENALQKTNTTPTPFFKPGWLGNYFTSLMLSGKNGIIGKKMQSPKNHVPSTDVNPHLAITAFLDQQQQLLCLLETAKTKNIGKIRVPISLSRFIKLKAGDTFRFLIAHEQRHFLQIKNVLMALGGFSDKYPAIHPAA
jgi:hypothetical protein